MTCIVKNQSDEPITNWDVRHVWLDTVDSWFQQATLLPGDTYPFDITVGDGGIDLWSVSFVVEGTTWSRLNKQCDVTEADFTSNRPVTVGFNVIQTYPFVTFDVATPVSSPCLANHMT